MMMRHSPKPKRTYPSITGAPYWNRLIAYVVDLILLLIVGVFSFAFTDGIYSNSKAGKTANAELHQLRFDSGLYIIYNETSESQYLSEDITSGNNEAIFFARLEYFYTAENTHFDYTKSSFYSELNEFNYHTMVLKMGDATTSFDFTVEDEVITYKLKETLSKTDKENVWRSVYQEALNNFQTGIDYTTAEKPIKQFVTFNLALSAFIGAILPNLLFPFLFGHGRSLGKFVTGIAVVNKDGYQVTKGQVIIRFFVYSIIETAANIYLFFIPLLLTSGVLTITHNNRAIHDLVSGTYVVDAKKSLIFKSKEDEERYFTSSEDEQRENKTFFTENPLKR